MSQEWKDPEEGANLVAAKHDYNDKGAVNRAMRRGKRCAARCRACCCCSRRCALALIVFSVLCNVSFIGATIGLAVRAPRVMAYLFSLNSEAEWTRRVACVADESCSACSQPLVYIDQPTGERAVLLAPRGSGGTLVRALAEAATGLRTGIDDCFIGHQMGHLFDPGDAPFVNECAGSMFFAHEVLVRGSLSKTRFWENHAGYVPTRMLYLRRNPLDTARSAFEFVHTCGGLATMTCIGKSAPASVFTAEHGWPGFAESAAHRWVEHDAEFDAFAGAKLRVDFEDLVARKPDALRALVEFLRPAAPLAVPSADRALACLAHNDALAHHDTRRDSSTAKRAVFSSALVERVCAVVGRRWDAARWGVVCA